MMVVVVMVVVVMVVGRGVGFEFTSYIIIPLCNASASFVFHISATSLAKGSSGLGALSNAWIESNTVLI